MASKSFINVFLLTFSFFNVWHSFSQIDYGDNLDHNLYTASNITVSPSVQPPDVAAFQKSSFIPVSHYTGRANISIPIYEIVEGDIRIPISLSYNSSGVKVNEMASNVGLNWSLNAGGVVSRLIKGMDDFHVPRYLGPISDKMTPAGWMGYCNPNVDTRGDTNGENDANPDRFVVQAPGLSTSYIHKRTYSNNSHGGVRTPPDPVELEHNGNLIDESWGFVNRSYLNDYTQAQSVLRIYGFQQISIKSLDGIQYNFSTPEISRYHQGTGNIDYKIESYKLDTIVDLSNNRKVIFEYEQYSNYFSDEFQTKGGAYGGGTYFIFGVDKSHTVFPVTNRLRKIRFSLGEVEFIYDHTRSDNTGEKALTEIKVRDWNGNQVKHLKFRYGYFQSSIEYQRPQSKRLRLDEIYEVDNKGAILPGHKFFYNESIQMPPRDSYAHDYLGYNNGSYNSGIATPIPQYYYYNGQVLPYAVSGSVYLPGNYSLNPNLNYAKAYSLEKIIFPTGGSAEYVYELNEFSGRLGGGLRVKNQTINDNNGNAYIKEYSYSGGKIMRMPVYAVFRIKKAGIEFNPPSTLSELEEYIGIQTFISPTSHVEFTNGSFVGYDNVEERDVINNGSTSYYFTNFLNQPSEVSGVTDSDWLFLSPRGINFDLDFKRGKLLRKEIRNTLGVKVYQEIYTYREDNFGNINLYYLNKAMKNGEINCYDQNGDYLITTCGGFNESVDLPFTRYLLTSVLKETFSQNSDESSYWVMDYYKYDANFPLVVEETFTDCFYYDSREGIDVPCLTPRQGGFFLNQVKSIKYPVTGNYNGFSINDYAYAGELVNQNRISTPMEISWNNRKEKQIFDYGLFNSNQIELQKIKSISLDGLEIPTTVILKRDNKGNVIEYLDRNGIKNVNLFIENGRILIATIKNSSYLDVINTGINLQGFNELSAEQKKSQLGILRNGLAESQVTSYLFKPLIGLTEIIDSRGESKTFSYDGFNRLITIKDSEGNLISENQYHYKE